MPRLLAYAEQTDLSGSQWNSIVWGVVVFVAAAGLAVLPIVIARTRWHRQSGAIAAAAVVWGLLAGGSAFMAVLAQLAWKKDYVQLISTGYYDPRNKSDAPALPWALWIPLIAAYVILLAYAFSQKNPPEPFDDPPGDDGGQDPPQAAPEPEFQEAGDTGRSK